MRMIAVFALAFMFLPQFAAAADCPAGVDPVYCQTAEATGGKVYSGSPEEVTQQLMADEAARAAESRRIEAARQAAETRDQLKEWTPVVLPLLLPLLLTMVLTRWPRRSHLFDVGYGLACATAPIGVLIEYLYVFSQGYSSSTLLGLLDITSIAVILALAVPAFMLSWLTKGDKGLLWGGAAMSGLIVGGLVYFLVSGGGIH